MTMLMTIDRAENVIRWIHEMVILHILHYFTYKIMKLEQYTFF